MDELDMIEAFAKLDGLDYQMGQVSVLQRCKGLVGDVVLNKYRPLDNFTLTYKAMIKYNVRMQGHKIYIGSMRNKSTVVNEHVNDTEKVAHAIIECILKHNNLWSQ